MICLFGGTFDPVHLGHLHAARTVCDRLGLDRIRMLLSARPGHRGGTGASVARRWEMLVAACADDPRLQPDDLEVRRAERGGRPSFTAETLEELRREAPRAAIAWVVGSDAYRDLMSWHRWRDVLTLANLVVLRRPGAELELAGELETMTREHAVRRIDAPAGGVLLLDAPMLEISATAVRQALARGAEAAHLLHPAVYTYIKKYHLYGVISDA